MYAHHTTAFANLRDFQYQLGGKLECCCLWRDEITSEIPLIPKLFCRRNNLQQIYLRKSRNCRFDRFPISGGMNFKWFLSIDHATKKIWENPKKFSATVWSWDWTKIHTKDNRRRDFLTYPTKASANLTNCQSEMALIQAHWSLKKAMNSIVRCQR